jgi:hypothetical protein
MQSPALFEPFDGGDLSSADASHGGTARTSWHTIKKYRAGAALAFPTTVLGSGQFEIIAQDAEDGPLAIHIQRHILAVHVQLSNPGHKENDGAGRRSVTPNSAIS